MSNTENYEDGLYGALSALQEDPTLSWIRGSALTERAFLIGVLKFFNAAFPDQEDNRIGRLLMATLWARPDDDPFPSSELGKLYSDLQSGLESYCSYYARGPVEGMPVIAFPDDLITQINDLVRQSSEHLSRSNRSAMEACQQIIYDMRRLDSEIKGAPTPEREVFGNILHSLRSLEDPLRFLSGARPPQSMS